jgi:hypothetical protein
VKKGSRQRIAGVAAASWVLATAVTSLVVWRAVAVFNDPAATNVLTAPQVKERLEAARVTPTASPTVTATAAQTPSDTPTPTSASSAPTSDDPTTTSEPTNPSSSTATRSSTRPSTPVPTDSASTTPVAKTWTVAGGTVSVSCLGQAITLVYATPQDGWRVETEKRGTDRIDVNFQRVGKGTELRASCVAGIPEQTNQTTEGDH